MPSLVKRANEKKGERRVGDGRWEIGRWVGNSPRHIRCYGAHNERTPRASPFIFSFSFAASTGYDKLNEFNSFNLSSNLCAQVKTIMAHLSLTQSQWANSIIAITGFNYLFTFDTIYTTQRQQTFVSCLCSAGVSVSKENSFLSDCHSLIECQILWI